MKKSLMKFVFHEQEVADVTFHAMVETGRVVLHTESSSGRESSMDLIGRAFALPCLCYAERGWQRRGRLSGPPGRMERSGTAAIVHHRTSFQPKSRHTG